MKTLLTALLMIASLAARADDIAPKTAFLKTFSQPGVGTLKVEMLDFYEPIDFPYVMNVKLLCEDHRSAEHKNKVTPTWEDIVKDRHMSELRNFYFPEPQEKECPPEYHGKPGVLELRFCLEYGGCKPMQDKIQCFDIERLCKAWQQ
jgi:hypothetical protein